MTTEQVQDPAGKVESVFRYWLSAQNKRPKSSKDAPLKGAEEPLEIVRRDLRSPLGTPKWQLDEFEKALMSTRGEKHSSSFSKMRHQPFVKAINDQISGVQKAPKDFSNERNEPDFRWIVLNAKAKDDFARCRCASEDESHGRLRNADDLNVSCPSTGNANGFTGSTLINRYPKLTVKMSEKRFLDRASTEETYDTRAMSSRAADTCSWKIAISDDNKERCLLESQNKDPGRSSSLWNRAEKLGIPARLKRPQNGVKNRKNPHHNAPAISKLKHLVCEWAGSVHRRLQISQNIFQDMTWILVLLCLVSSLKFMLFE